MKALKTALKTAVLLLGYFAGTQATAGASPNQDDSAKGRMLIFLGQMEFAKWIDQAMERGWKGDGFHSYRVMDEAECRSYFDKCRKHRQRVMLTIGDTILRYGTDNPGQTREDSRLAKMEAIARANQDIFWGWHCEGRWVLDKVVINRIMDEFGRERLILYDNGLTDPTGRAKRQSRLWYPNQRAEPWPSADQAKDPAFSGQWFDQHPDVRAEITSLYPLALLSNVRSKGVEISCWVAANGVPADDPLKIKRELGYNLGLLSLIYVQPRVDKMWFYLLSCETIGCRAAYFYSYSVSSYQWQTMSSAYPRLWYEMNEAIDAYKAGRVPRTWKAQDNGRYILEKDFLRLRRQLTEAQARIKELETSVKPPAGPGAGQGVLPPR